MHTQLTGPVPSGLGGDAAPVDAPPVTDCQAVADVLYLNLVVYGVVFALALLSTVVGVFVLVRHRRHHGEASGDGAT